LQRLAIRFYDARDPAFVEKKKLPLIASARDGATVSTPTS
jgi:hypothetical protein